MTDLSKVIQPIGFRKCKDGSIKLTQFVGKQPDDFPKHMNVKVCTWTPRDIKNIQNMLGISSRQWRHAVKQLIRCHGFYDYGKEK